MKVLLLDNYDSFTYNLVQYIEEELGTAVDVYRNDQISLEAVAAYDLVVLSPGPGVPKDAGIMPELIQRYAAEKIIFGVCLGHQAIGEAFGAQLYNLSDVFHGIAHEMHQTEVPNILFENIEQQFQAGRYHSWAIEPNSLPETLLVTAVTAQGDIMALRHRDYDVFGVQFHPESIMTTEGRKMIRNLLAFVRMRLAESVPA